MQNLSNNIPVVTTQEKRIGKAIYRTIDSIIYAGGFMAGMLIVLSSAMVVYEIIARNIFNSPTIWTVEYTIYALIGSCFLGAPYTLRINEHINVDLLINNVSPKVKKVMGLVSALFILLFSIIFTWKSWEYVQHAFTLGTTSDTILRTPMYIPYFLLPIGGLLFLMSIILNLVDYKNGKGGE